MGAYHTMDLKLNRKFQLTQREWDSIAIERVEMACNVTQSTDVAAVIMQDGLVHVCLITLLRKMDMAIPRKRKANVQQQERVLPSSMTPSSRESFGTSTSTCSSVCWSRRLDL